MSDSIHYRPFTVADVDAAHALTLELKWPHRAEDWHFVTNLGEGFVAERDGRVIGTVLCWKYGEDTSSLGMVIVSPAFQGYGIGRRLAEMALEALGARATVLHATPAGLPLYEKLGFAPIGTLDQHQGAALQPPLLPLPARERLRPLGVNDTPRLVELASRASGLDRSAVLPALLACSDGIGLDRDGELIGFALFRRFGRGRAIGPVVAPRDADPVRAKAMIGHWLASNPGMFIRIDTPRESGLTEWLEALGLTRVDSVVKMARNAERMPPSDEALAQYGIINQAIG
ncbi:GNAT family N-acetyltransferase [Trinickia sp. Y13]|uniref:GNAT family N-acetyltransferase n=1 Tax=Trinickia sp. Y13 TaxID=2917807 RepID=UPI002404A1FB|nr:GNAT family N-acetyltransferase [Trinickia sp. Y13]MDG0027732.1 GNAT family N-acetyltransferase [Trinickia sp. Y13]